MARDLVRRDFDTVALDVLWYGDMTETGHIPVIKPAPLQQAVPGGFIADTVAATVICPAGHVKALGKPQRNGQRQAQFKALCRQCPLRARCTKSKTGRVFSVHADWKLLKAARDQAATDPT